LRALAALARDASRCGLRVRLTNLRRLHHEVLTCTGNTWLAEVPPQPDGPESNP
jgi:hypothetical protein